MTPGTYRLTQDLPAFKPDKRKRNDWRAAPVKAGTIFIVVPLYFEAPAKAPLRAYTGPWSHNDVRVTDFPAGALEPVVETPSQWLRREHSTNCAWAILDTLVERGVITLADVQEVQAWNDDAKRVDR